MTKRVSGRRLTCAAILFLALGTSVSGATTLSFYYSGHDVTGIGGSSAGTGTLTFSGAPLLVGLANLTSFGFSQTTSIPGESSSFAYVLSDLTSFSLSLTEGLPATFSLKTVPVPGSNPLFFPESFTVTGFGPSGAFTSNNSGATLQVGSVTFIPEPGSLGLIALGFVCSRLLVGLRLARRKDGLLSGVSSLGR